ncbi:SHOCT domain-containing protein [Terrisporobacter petrolearius]|uniref:SHOCT domain-containing protein n=1 Tax=Terrisporobacter petrolearius TaxID=1460447 RepID=UPI003B008305
MKKELDWALEIKQYLESYKPNNTNNSSADEILKYKNLLDMGAITEEEFNDKKKQLLGV